MKSHQKTAYQKKLEDPRWQKKRLEALERAGWKCEGCDAETEQLHVHHRYYVSKREPWDYPQWTYKVLCKTCHKIETEINSTELQDFERVFEMVGDPSVLFVMLDDIRCTHQLNSEQILAFVGRFLPKKVPISDS